MDKTYIKSELRRISNAVSCIMNHVDFAYKENITATEVETYCNTIGELQRQIDDATICNRNATDRIRELKVEQETHKDMVVQMRNKNNKLTKENLDLKEQINDLQERNDVLQEQLNNRCEQIENLNCSLINKLEEKEKLQFKLNAVYQKVKEIAGNIE